MKAILIIGLTVATLSSCNKMIDRSSGPLTTETRVTTDFNEIHMQDHIDVQYTQGSSTSVTVEAGENLIDYIQTDVVNGKLVIYESSNTIGNHKRIKVTITNDSLTNIEMEGSGDFNGSNMSSTNLNLSSIGSGNFNSDAVLTQLNISSTGSGDIQITGACDTQVAVIKGSGDLNSRFMIAANVDVHLVGSGDAWVHSTSVLDAKLEGSGDIYFYGNPGTVTSSNTGSGDIILKN